MNPPLRILLSEAASKHLENHGGECFLANAAVRIAQGLSTERKAKIK